MTDTATQTPAIDPAVAKRAIIDKAVSEVAHIATLPEITLKIIEVVEDPDSTANDLHQIISNDPALCARVLKVVNSAFYGLPGQIGSINRAIVLLGLNAVKNIAIATSLAKLFRGGRLCPSFSAQDLWAHSIAVAATVRLVADRAKVKMPDEAFLGGLIHDIGIMVEMQSMRPKLLEVLERTEAGVNFIEAEEHVIGANHQDFGAALCEKWKFPHSFVCVTGYHHRPTELSSENRTLTAVVHVADVLAARNQIGFSTVAPGAAIDPKILAQLRLSDDDVNEIGQQVPEAYEVTDQLLR